MLASLAGQALAQEAATPTIGRPYGSGAPAGVAPGGTGLSSSPLTLPPGMVGNPGTPLAVPRTAGAPSQEPPPSWTGSGRRPGLRDRKPRRFRQPAATPFQGNFRPTLAPPEVAYNVQPIQVGLPDLAVPLVTARRRPVLVDDPYAPIGLRVGNIHLFPVIGEAIGYDSNPNRIGSGRHGSFVSQTEAELGIQSDWSRHAVTGFVRGAYNAYPGDSSANRPEGAGRVGVRLDVARDTQADVEGHYQIDTQRQGNPNLLGAPVITRPIVSTGGGSLGVTQRFNRLIVTVRGTADHTDYEDARLGAGIVLDQGDRNYAQYGVRARLAYEVTPALLPFLEALADTRQYDRRIDNSGFERSSEGAGGRIGTSFELTRLLTGEVSAGAVNRSYRDARLRDLTSPIADVSLAYALTPLTTIRATGQATVDETTIPNANGVRTVRATLEASHALRRNLTLTAGLTAAEFDYQGVSVTERSFGALLRADYRLTRQVAVRASYNYETLHSTVAGSSYTANVFLLGMRLQP